MCTLHLFQDKLIPISYESVLLTFNFFMVSENQLALKMNDFDYYVSPE